MMSTHRVIVEINVHGTCRARDGAEPFVARGNMIVAGFLDEACALEMGDVVARALHARYGGKRRCEVSLHVEAVRDTDEHMSVSAGGGMLSGPMVWTGDIPGGAHQ